MKQSISIFAVLIAMSTGAVFSATLDTTSARTIVADKIEYNARDKSVSTTGKTTVTNASGQRMTLKDSYLSSSGETVSGSDIKMQLSPQVYVTAKDITRTGEFTDAARATYTACYGCDDMGNAWEISAKRITHDNEEHQIDFYNPVLRVYGVPVFWFPKLAYPDPSIKRKSGLLMPDFNSTNNMGTQFNFPVYIALSDTHDMTVTASYLTDENPLWQLEHRLNADHMEFRTRGSFTRNKDGENRWHLFNNDIIEMGEYARTFVFFQRASDNTYLQKYGFYNAQPYLNSGLRTELFAESGYATVEARFFQELRKSQQNRSNPSGDILPQIHGVYQTDSLFADTYMSFMGDILGIMNNDAGTASQRLIGEASITSPWTIWGGQRITASASARYDLYNFKNTDMADGRPDFSGLENRFLPSGYLEWGLPLARSGESWTHMIQPRARITFMEKQDQSAFALTNDSAGALLSDAILFSNNRFSGYDMWENGTYMDYGMGWSAFKDDGKAIKTFIGQSYDFEPQDNIDPNSGFHKGLSDYVGRLSYESGGRFSIATRLRVAEYDLALRHIETNARLGGRNYLTLGHMWAVQLDDTQAINKKIQEVNGGFNVFLTDRFTVRLNARYNITDQRFQGHRGGVYYDHPCYTIGFEYSHDNAIKQDYVGNTKFRLQFALKINGNGRTFLEQDLTFSGRPVAQDEDFANF